MAYADDIAQDYHRVGFYIRFRGIPTRISTHDPADWPNWNPSETYAATIVNDSLSGLSETLNRQSSVIEQGSLSWEVMATADMVALFARRGGTEDQLAAAINDVTSTVTTTDASLPTTGGTVVYCDRETMTIASGGGGTYTVSRGQEDSETIAHATGALISTQPRFWFTRRFTLYAVNLETGTEAALYTGTLDSSPIFSDGKFSFSGQGIISSYLKRPLHTGWQEIESESTSSSRETLDITVKSTVGVSSPGYLRLSGSAGSMVVGGFLLANAPQITATQISVNNSSFVAGDITAPTELSGEQVSVEQVTVVVGTPGRVALQAILSREGDQSNSDFDVLEGKFADTAGSDELFRDLRMGAGIDELDVDIVSFNQIPSDYDIAAWIDETISLGDFLTDEILFRCGGYVFTTPAGVLTHKPYTSNAIRGGLTAYTPDDVLTSNVAGTDDETGGIARVLIECNYRPFTREFLRSIELVFRDDRAIYGDIGESLSLKTKSINVGTSSTGIASTHLFSQPSSLIELESSFDRQRARQSWAGRRMSLRLPWRQHNTFTVGYRFKWTDARMIDFEGGTGVTDRYFEVTGRQLDLGTGEVYAECDEVPRGYLLCPSAFVTAWDGGTLTLTLDTTTDLHDLSPGLDVNSNWGIVVYDASANFSVSDFTQVTSVTASQIVVAAAPVLSGGAAPAAGDLVVLYQTGDTNNLNDVDADVEDYAFAADANFTVGSAPFPGPRWS